MSIEGTRGDLEFSTIPKMLAISASKWPQAHAVEDGDTTLSYAELESRVREAAKSLMALGIEPGDCIAIWAPNMWEWIVAALATHSVGAAVVTVNTRYKGSEAAYLLETSRARALFTVNGFLDTNYCELLDAANCKLPALENVIVMRGSEPKDTLSWHAFLAKGREISDAAALARRDTVMPEDRCDIIFTSGTTGKPKGVMCCHGQTLRAFRDWADVVGLQAGDRYLIVLPFFHSFGYKAGLLAALMMGCTILPEPVFDADKVLQRIGADRVTMLPGPPALYQAILANPKLKEYDISSLRLAVTGAASIPVELILRMRRELDFETIITGYGLTEASGIATMCRYDDDPETIAQTSGRAIPGVEVEVQDDAGNELPRGEAGELVVRGYNVMQGYFDDAEQTAATIDARGWLHTGDIGVMDERGYIKITDRKKDMFIVGGFNAYPAEIENALLARAEIAQVAVVGMPDERQGEVGAAFIMLMPGKSLEKDELLTWCRANMANYKVPRYIEFVESFPTNATGKVLKFELRDRLARG